MEHDKDVELNLLSEFPPPSFDQWKIAVEETLKGADFDKAMKAKTYEGITLEPIYRREDVEHLEFLKALPGEPPYQRGSKPDGYTSEPWLVAQLQDNPDLEMLNEELLDELLRGLNCVNLLIHPDSLCGKFPSHADKRGVALSCLNDIKALLAGVKLEAIPVFAFGNENVILQLALISAYAKSTGISNSDLSGVFAFDPLAQVYLDKAFKPERGVRIARQMTIWAELKASGIKTILIDASIYANGGANAVQELGYALASAVYTLDAMIESGLTIEQVAPRFVLKLSLGSNFYMEIAKVRAARMLWSELIKAYGGGQEAQKLWIHGVTGSFNKTRYDIYVNILRSATEGFAAVIGGVDSLEITPFDSNLRAQEAFSKRIARNQQIILGEEAHFSKVVDPAGGCYYIETLCSELSHKAWKLMQMIESSGGMRKYISGGMLHKEIQAVANERIDNVDKRRDIVIGVNMYADPAEKPLMALEPVHAWLGKAKARRQANKADSGLAQSLTCLKDHPDNDLIVDMIADAWLRNADIEQISEALNLKVEAIPTRERLSAAMHLEALRDAVLAHRSINKADVMMLGFGINPQIKPRVDFSIGFLQIAAFDIVNQNVFESVVTAVNEVATAKPKAVCVCATDESYPSLVSALCRELKALPTPPVIILAGYPTDMVESYRTAGVEIFIHLRANAFETLKDIAIRMGVNA
ncbi:MAG: acyl-CoA mutase large subunit family protein [Candidatus Cloacimonadaceae bacterium]|nr:acyl-CoA mutase large subunit family protein [Candidatus Cloacimonadaceae bacterium]